jgi:hypothetical protein
MYEDNELGIGRYLVLHTLYYVLEINKYVF